MIAALAAAALAAAATPAFAQCPLYFAPAANNTTVVSSYFVAAGDFNGDGRPDLATAAAGNTVSILLGNAKGTFQQADIYPGVANPRFVAVSDFNGDGKPDLAVANFNGGSLNRGNVSILLGNGNGTFQVPFNSYDAGGQPVSIAVSDFNGDGWSDLAVANNSSNNVSILLGNGSGTFQPAVNYAVLSSASSVVTGDFNADGKPDLAVANYTPSGFGYISILLGNVGGTFQAAVNYIVGGSAFSVAVGDFNADGRPDLATANISGTVSILLCNANGTFLPPVNYNVENAPVSVAVGDFNTDGRPDLAVACANGSAASILQGNGNGTFQAGVNFAVDNSPWSLAVGDFDADGRPDLAVAHASRNYISVLLNSPITQHPAPVAVCPSGTIAFSIATAASAGPFTYQWQLETSPDTWVDAINGGLPYNGGSITASEVTTDTLHLALNTLPGAPNIRFRCVVTNTCDSVTSDPATLFIAPADLGQQGGVPGADGLYDNNDFVVFIDLFFNQQPAADLGKQGGLLGSDGQFDNNDFVVFIDQFFAACP